MSKFSGKGPSQRQLRVGENVRHALTQVLQRGEIQDDVITRTVISISEVSMSPDLKIATCYISPLDNYSKIDALLHSPEVQRDLDEDGEEDQ